MTGVSVGTQDHRRQPSGGEQAIERDMQGRGLRLAAGRGGAARKPCALAVAVLALALLARAALAADQSGHPSSAGSGDLGPAVQAGNRDCPPLGSPQREPSPVARPGAVSCAPTGSGPPTGYPPDTPPASPSSAPNM